MSFLSLSFLFLSSSTLVPDILIGDPRMDPGNLRGSSVVLFAKTGRSKDPGSPIESGMTEGRKQRHPWRHVEGACRRGCAAVPNFLWGRGLFERSACPEQREGTLNQQPSAWKSRFLPSTDSGQARDPSLRSGQARNDNGAAPEGPRLGAHGFGSFCRNKRISPCGGETPQFFPPRRVGATTPQAIGMTIPCGGETPQSFLHSVPDKPDDWNDHSCIGRATHRTQKKQREKC